MSTPVATVEIKRSFLEELIISVLTPGVGSSTVTIINLVLIASIISSLYFAFLGYATQHLLAIALIAAALMGSMYWYVSVLSSLDEDGEGESEGGGEDEDEDEGESKNNQNNKGDKTKSNTSKKDSVTKDKKKKKK